MSGPWTWPATVDHADEIVETAGRFLATLTRRGMSVSEWERLSVESRDRVLEVGAWSGIEDRAVEVVRRVTFEDHRRKRVVFSGDDGATWRDVVPSSGPVRAARIEADRVRCATSGCDYQPGHPGRCDYHQPVERCRASAARMLSEAGGGDGVG